MAMRKKTASPGFKMSRLLTGLSKVFIGKILFKKFHFIPHRPPMLVVELTNNCNLRCIMCEYPLMQRDGMNMDTQLAKKVLKECSEWGISRVGLSRLGEPLLHPDISEIIKFAKESGIRHVSMVCNAMLLTEEKAQKIIDSGLDLILFSIDAARKETFEKIRKGADYDKVVTNIERFIKMRNELSQEKPWIEVNICLMKENVDELPLIIEKWGQLVERVKICPVVPLEHTNDNLIVDAPTYNGKKKACDFLWTRMVVLSNGDVTVCCADKDGDMSVGNAQKSSLKELWNSDKIRRIREIHFSKKFEKLPLCKQCCMVDEDWFNAEKAIINKYEKEWKPFGILPSSFFS
ncbi:Fe-S oxidoreductase [Candidatus Scalindua japonica]|uniref:Fe-S oxidoreductase n=1 Tax=Candidatus Scalindua japonica TaxID=1284222 RepID=A0A286TX47_9BACT|nr:radical SAM/SPASM domain-containing protein [Candidatus Scalindua japonica]GAX60411.1 Fe-S oxidoreductase [Candidatus Scalindua japonica]